MKVGSRQRDRRLREVDAGHDRAAPGEARQVDACAASDFENAPPSISVEVDEAQQMMELFEMILVEIVEEPTRSHRVPGDLEIVDVSFPVRANIVSRRHAG